MKYKYVHTKDMTDDELAVVVDQYGFMINVTKVTEDEDGYHSDSPGVVFLFIRDARTNEVAAARTYSDGKRPSPALIDKLIEQKGPIPLGYFS